MIYKFEDYTRIIKKVFPKSMTNDDVVYLCIGSDRSCGDALAPMVGTMLTTIGYQNVYGTLDDPVHALNLSDIIVTLPKDKIVIAIDACLGQQSSVGKIEIHKRGIRPGAGVNKCLPEVGDYSITGVVNVGGFMEYYVLQNTRLSLVKNMADTIAKLIQYRFPKSMNSDTDSISIIKWISNMRRKLNWVAGTPSMTEEDVRRDLDELRKGCD